MRWLLAIVFLACTAAASAADVLREARVRIELADPVTCSVTASIVVDLDSSREVEHRLQRLDGSRIELLGVEGTDAAAAPRTIGTTEALAIRFPGGTHRYDVRYRVVQPAPWPYRCPVWVPAVATDGHSRNIEIEVVLPPGARAAGGAFPAFDWDGGTGRAALGNLPAFVRIPYVAAGESREPTRDLGRTMDLVAVGVLIAGTAWWVVRRRR